MASTPNDVIWGAFYETSVERRQPLPLREGRLQPEATSSVDELEGVKHLLEALERRP